MGEKREENWAETILLNPKPVLETGNDHTVIIKPSLGRVTPALQREAPPPVDHLARLSAVLDKSLSAEPQLGASLAVACAPLLNIAVKLRETQLPLDGLKPLHNRLTDALKDLEQQLQQCEAKEKHRKDCCYILCLFLDESIQHNPNITPQAWSQFGLAQHFFQKQPNDDSLFSLLEMLQNQPDENHQLLELIYQVLSLGFLGKYRSTPDARIHLEQLRKSLFRLLAGRGSAPAQPATHWRSSERPPNQILQQIPFWWVPSLCLLAGLIFFSVQYFSLSAQSDRVFEQIHSIQITAPNLERPKPTLEQRSIGDFLNQRLAEPLAAKRLRITFAEHHWIVSLIGDGLFQSGSDQIKQDYLSTLREVSRALRDTTGSIRIVGHTDSIPIRSLRFPSNFELSAGRALQILKQLAKTVPHERMESEGSGASRPVASNQTAQGRAQNRRVEIWLKAPSAQFGY